MNNGTYYLTEGNPVYASAVLSAVAQNGEVVITLPPRCEGRGIAQVVNSSGVVIAAAGTTHSITFSGNTITYKNLAAGAFTGTFKVMSLI